MAVIIYMVNIFTTRENRVLSFNSSTQTYRSLLAVSPSHRRAVSNEKKISSLRTNFVTGLVDAEGSFIVFIKLNSNNSIKLVRQIQL